MSVEPERLGDVLPFVRPDASRARHDFHGFQAVEVQPHDHDARATTFEEAAAELGLDGPNRDLCARAWEEKPERCELLLRLTRKYAKRNPAGYFVRSVKNKLRLSDEALAVDDAELALRVAPAEPERPLNRCGCRHPDCRYQNTCLQEVER